MPPLRRSRDRLVDSARSVYLTAALALACAVAIHAAERRSPSGSVITRDALTLAGGAVSSSGGGSRLVGTMGQCAVGGAFSGARSPLVHGVHAPLAAPDAPMTSWAVLEYLLGRVDPPPEELPDYDIDGDGACDIVDHALLVLQGL